MFRTTARGAFLAGALLPATLAAPAAAADLGPLIQDIQEAGISNCESGPEDLGPRFYQSVRDACVGNASCQVSPTDVASEDELLSYGCTNFFVIAVCGPEDLQEYEASSLSERLSVFCDAP